MTHSAAIVTNMWHESCTHFSKRERMKEVSHSCRTKQLVEKLTISWKTRAEQSITLPHTEQFLTHLILLVIAFHSRLRQFNIYYLIIVRVVFHVCLCLSLSVCFVSCVRRHLNWMNIFNRKINMLCVYDGWMMPFIRRIAYGSHILCIHVYTIFYLSSLCLPCVINIGRNRCSVCVRMCVFNIKIRNSFKRFRFSVFDVNKTTYSIITLCYLSLLFHGQIYYI